MKLNIYTAKWLNNFIYNDYAPLDGKVKTILYGLLLWKGYSFFFELFEQMTEVLPPEFFVPAGILKLLPKAISIDDIKWFIANTKILFLISWCLAIIGLGGRTPYVITGLLALIFMSFNKYCVTSDHKYYLPMYALFLIGMTYKNDKWSIDYLIGKYFTGYYFKPDLTAKNYSGIALKALLIFTAFSYFAAGMTKLLNGGIGWAGVETFYENMGVGRNESQLRKEFSDMAMKHRWIIYLLSGSTLLFELIALIILFSKRSRPYFFLAAMGFHIGVLILMKPDFMYQGIVYIVLIDWNSLIGKQLKYIKIDLSTHEWSPPAHSKLVTGGIALLLLMNLFVSVAEFEEYPFSNFPMYGEKITSKYRGSYNIENFNSIDKIKYLSSEYVEKGKPHGYRTLLSKYMVIERREEKSEEWEKLGSEVIVKNTEKTWRHRMSYALASDLKDYRSEINVEFMNTKRLLKAIEVFYNKKNNEQFRYRLKLNLHGNDGIIIMN